MGAYNSALRQEIRVAAGREAEPGAVVLDSQSVKTPKTPGVRGYDAVKKINGRKCHLLVDTLGLVLMVVVHAANIQDRDGAKLVLEKARGCFPRLRLIWADGGYAGKLVDWVKAICLWVLEIVKRSDDVKGFQVLPHRWVVERTFGWLGRYRRLSKDYEGLTESSEDDLHRYDPPDGQTAGSSASAGHGLTGGFELWVLLERRLGAEQRHLPSLCLPRTVTHRLPSSTLKHQIGQKTAAWGRCAFSSLMIAEGVSIIWVH